MYLPVNKLYQKLQGQVLKFFIAHVQLFTKMEAIYFMSWTVTMVFIAVTFLASNITQKYKQTTGNKKRKEKIDLQKLIFMC
jgi:hypothetical protein